MSAIIILTPAIIASWPAITAAVAGAAAAMGLSVAQEVQDARHESKPHDTQTSSVELNIEDSEVLENSLSATEEIVLSKDDLTVRIKRDEYGRLRFYVTGKNRSKAELNAFGHEVVDKVTQTYIYNRVVTELKQRGLTIQQEEVTEDNTVHLYVRNTLD